MILFFGIALGLGLGFLLSKLFNLKSTFLIYAVAILLVLVVVTAITVLHFKLGVYERPTHFKTMRDLKVYMDNEFNLHLGNTISVTMAWFLLGYLALGASFVWFQLQKRKSQETKL